MGKFVTTEGRDKFRWEDSCLPKVQQNPMEPFFVLRAQDTLSVIAVRMWIMMYRIIKGEDRKYSEAMYTLHEMELYQRETGHRLPD